MEIQTFIEHFAEQFEDTDASAFNAETKFHDLDEWSSLTALTIIAMVDEEYDVKIKGDDIRTSSTIDALFDIVKSRL
ncbi:MAG: phosphopantetheine-binding protein [Bacteroidales bacterium]|jgi:acyl carrier protein|nr:phosphopantetheine-binding protein [Bacteroidales bacterium]